MAFLVKKFLETGCLEWTSFIMVLLALFGFGAFLLLSCYYTWMWQLVFDGDMNIE